MCVVASIVWKLMSYEVLYTTCIPNLGFILARVTSLEKKFVNLQMKNPLNV